MYDYENVFDTADLICDYCDNYEVFEGDYYSCLAEAKEYGWIIRKINNEWYHFCNQECFDLAKEKGII